MQQESPNNDLNVMTDDTEGIRMTNKTEPKLHLLLPILKGVAL